MFSEKGATFKYLFFQFVFQSTSNSSVLCVGVFSHSVVSMGFSWQECWSGLPFPTPGDLSNPGIQPTSLASPALAGRFFTTAAPGKPTFLCYFIRIGNNLPLLKDGWTYFFLVDQWEPGTEYFLKDRNFIFSSDRQMACISTDFQLSWVPEGPIDYLLSESIEASEMWFPVQYFIWCLVVWLSACVCMCTLRSRISSLGNRHFLLQSSFWAWNDHDFPCFFLLINKLQFNISSSFCDVWLRVQYWDMF